MTSQPPSYGQNIVRVSTADILAALGGSVVTSVTGTINQVTVTPVPGVFAVTVSLPSSGTLPGSWHAATGFTVDAGRFTIPVAPDATQNYGLVSLGSGAFDGVTAGFFSGNSNGTHIAVNTAAGYAGRMIDLQVAGVRTFAVGNQSFASATSAVFRGIDIRPITVTISGNTAITTAAGVNYVEIGQPTYSTAAAITIGSTLTIINAPTVAGGGSLATALALWVQAGAVRFSGASVVSLPSHLYDGAWFTGGSATTTKPHVLIEPTGATSTAWSTAGTGLGINAASGFTGNLLDLQLNGVSEFKVAFGGNITTRTSAILAFGGGPTITDGASLDLNFNIPRDGTIAGGATATTYLLGIVGNAAVGGYSSFTIVPPAHTGLAADKPTFVINAATQTLLSGATIAEAAAGIRVKQRTFNGVAGGGAETITLSASVVIEGAPILGTNITMTSQAALYATTGSVVVGNAALATNATAGFVYIPTCAGTPTGTPQTWGSTVPLIYDSTNNILYIYAGGAWKRPKAITGPVNVDWE